MVNPEFRNKISCVNLKLRVLEFTLHHICKTQYLVHTISHVCALIPCWSSYELVLHYRQWQIFNMTISVSRTNQRSGERLGSNVIKVSSSRLITAETIYLFFYDSCFMRNPIMDVKKRKLKERTCLPKQHIVYCHTRLYQRTLFLLLEDVLTMSVTGHFKVFHPHT